MAVVVAHFSNINVFMFFEVIEREAVDVEACE